ncbi:hypothetical protein SAMN04515665_101237 [Blastococcus sp. DSM 46786]|uniref:hypothetical protein n=1 Tax=Blastococcus sp. DSM 46786 TaxID=1798227 RepID=UPI0008D00858|nr:hypothetical protein [Blastococcus sp. DSM 46786]SEK25705.1 hypothetical protein SAMN04515665_101237 [Blastococcus sp. DSM 46786]
MRLPLPQRIKARLARAVQARVDDAVRPVVAREDDLARRLDELTARIDRLAAAIDLKNVSERVDRLDQVAHAGEERLRRLDEQSTWNAHQISRLAPQAAALEQRLERQARPVVVQTDGQDLPEARSLVEVVREEHARVRARLSTLSAYEERIRRLEDSTFAPPAG